jgi:hypothetical protein
MERMQRLLNAKPTQKNRALQRPSSFFSLAVYGQAIYPPPKTQKKFPAGFARLFWLRLF